MSGSAVSGSVVSERFCQECGASKRMEGLPEDQLECKRCTGEELSPYEATRQEVANQRAGIPRFVSMRGVNDRPSVLGPGQGGYLVEGFLDRRDAARSGKVAP